MFYPRIVHNREWIGNHNLHAQRDTDRRKELADAAVANDAKNAAGQLPTHHDLRSPTGVVLRGRARNSARQIDHKAERELRHRLHEARPSPGDQHTRGGCSFDIDVTDIDGATNEGTQLWKPRENL